MRNRFPPGRKATLRIGWSGELPRPILGVLPGVDFKKPSAVVSAHKAILASVDFEFAIASAHKSLALPFAPALVHRIDIVELRRQPAAQKRVAIGGLQIPPAFADPSLAIGVGQRDAYAI